MYKIERNSKRYGMWGIIMGMDWGESIDYKKRFAWIKRGTGILKGYLFNPWDQKGYYLLL